MTAEAYRRFAVFGRGYPTARVHPRRASGMGGSSLGPEVLGGNFRTSIRSSTLLVLDSTDPAPIRSLEARIDPHRTLFLVSSKSGTTLEPNILKQYFLKRVRSALGAERAGRASSPSPTLARNCSRSLNESAFAAWRRQTEHWRTLLRSVGLRMVASRPDGDRDQGLAGIGAADGAILRSSVPPAENPGVILG